jgi:hypothetical protein
MDAHALVALGARAPWACPLFLLAETEGPAIRVTAQALSDLVIDEGDPFAAGPARGFRLDGPQGPVPLRHVGLAPDDPRAVLVVPEAPVAGPGWTLGYAAGPGGPLPHRGALRDRWQADPAGGGAPLHRWALPALLPVQPGAGA